VATGLRLPTDAANGGGARRLLSVPRLEEVEEVVAAGGGGGGDCKFVEEADFGEGRAAMWALLAADMLPRLALPPAISADNADGLFEGDGDIICEVVWCWCWCWEGCLDMSGEAGLNL